MDFPSGSFAAILADPPWSFATWSDRGRNRCPDGKTRQKGLIERHYRTMTLADIAALPVDRIAARDCALFLWAVDCMLPNAIEIGRGSWRGRGSSSMLWLGVALLGLCRNRNACSYCTKAAPREGNYATSWSERWNANPGLRTFRGSST